MKRQEIEQLLADYANGQISPEDRQRLESLFEADAAFKQEADEMAAVWASLKAVEEFEQPSVAMDVQFYAMLQNSKPVEQPKQARVIQINTSHLKTVAA